MWVRVLLQSYHSYSFLTLCFSGWYCKFTKFIFKRFKILKNIIQKCFIKSVNPLRRNFLQIWQLYTIFVKWISLIIVKCFTKNINFLICKVFTFTCLRFNFPALLKSTICFLLTWHFLFYRWLFNSCYRFENSNTFRHQNEEIVAYHSYYSSMKKLRRKDSVIS